MFSKYGPIADVSIVYDQQSRRPRGFAFVYFENVDDAKEVSKSLVPCVKKYMHTLSLFTHTHTESFNYSSLDFGFSKSISHVRLFCSPMDYAVPGIPSRPEYWSE